MIPDKGFSDLQRLAVAYAEEFGMEEVFTVSKPLKATRNCKVVTLVFEKDYKFFVTQDTSQLIWIDDG